MRELFDADLARAVKPSEKAATARRILDVALDTPDGDRDADRYAAFVLARETAIAGRDRATAFAASRAIAERYEQPCEGDPLAKGDELWKAASAKLGAERLRIEAEAAEWYGYALAGLKEGDFTRKLIEKRLTVEEPKTVAARPKNEKAEKDADLKLLIGTWDVNIEGPNGSHDTLWTFHADGIVNSANGIKRGTWVANKSQVVIVWSQDSWETLNRPITSKAIGDSKNFGLRSVHARQL